jgi:dephospho-CoA kinase
MMTHSPIIIGLTGNIGVGKSAALAVLRELGAYVIDADKVGHEVMTAGQPTCKKVAAAFGPDVVAATGGIDRAKLAAIVFADRAQLARLEAIVHPAVRQVILDAIAASSAPVVVIEAIKLLESPLRSLCHEIWVITAPEKVQLARLIRQRGMSEAEARGRMAAQSSQAVKVAQADVVIANDSDLLTLKSRLTAAWQALSTRYGNHFSGA